MEVVQRCLHSGATSDIYIVAETISVTCSSILHLFVIQVGCTIKIMVAIPRTIILSALPNKFLAFSSSSLQLP